ncbi:hypothetical protein, partial [Enterococcus faecium]|uniref:hypothetical protein n=1 Tax=Enterococcus faecium TaxID=1352 RepID=UPI001C539524
YHSSELPQIWDELRRRVGDASRLFPPGVVPPFVNDDFGDVFGFFFAISGDSFTIPASCRKSGMSYVAGSVTPAAFSPLA